MMWLLAPRPVCSRADGSADGAGAAAQAAGPALRPPVPGAAGPARAAAAAAAAGGDVLVRGERRELLSTCPRPRAMFMFTSYCFAFHRVLFNKNMIVYLPSVFSHTFTKPPCSLSHFPTHLSINSNRTHMWCSTFFFVPTIYLFLFQILCFSIIFLYSCAGDDKGQ